MAGDQELEHSLALKAKRHYTALCTRRLSLLFRAWRNQSHVNASLRHLDELLRPCKVQHWQRCQPQLQGYTHAILLWCHAAYAKSACSLAHLYFCVKLLQGLFDKPAHERGGDELSSVVQLLQGLQQFQGLCREAQLFVALHSHLLVLQEGVELSGYVVLIGGQRP